MNTNKKYKIIISGGGTGGHIFPALSIANTLKQRINADILFVGAENRMEMEKVPAEGYKIIGLPVAGFNRKNIFKNIGVLMKLRKSLAIANDIIKDFKPDIVIGVGGYASGPTLKAAQRAGIPTLIQEQNSYPGVTNKLLAKKADKICVAYEGMERYFPADKIVLTGNPVRKDILSYSKTKEEARKSFGLDPEKPTVLIVGGSLGAGTLNYAISDHLPKFVNAGVQLIWQTGKSFGDYAANVTRGIKGIVVAKFITNMAQAYAAATLVVSRAGACSISELELLGKPCILVPSPNVAEDHQTRNAIELVKKKATILIADGEARRQLADTIIDSVADTPFIEEMGRNIQTLALRDSDNKIVDHIIELISKEK